MTKFVFSSERNVPLVYLQPNIYTTQPFEAISQLAKLAVLYLPITKAQQAKLSAS